MVGIAATMTFALSCKKESNGGPLPTQVSLQALFEENVVAATQVFTLNAGTGGTITGTQGTKLLFGANAFLHGSGSPVIGTVEVRLVEALTIGDMIWLNKRTVGNDGGTERLMRSGGELKISAIQGSEELRIVDNGVTIDVPAATVDLMMDVFVGTVDPDGTIIWDPMDSTTVTIDPDSSGGSYYWFQADSLTWINCDYFYTYPSTTDITAMIPAGQPIDSSMVWIAFPSENAVMEMYVTGPSTFSTWQVVPVGMNAVVIGLYRNGAAYYSSFNTVTITNAMNVPMTFSPTTLAQFQTDLDGI